MPPNDLPYPGQQHSSQPRYQYVPPRRPPRRSTGGTLAAAVGGLAALGVVAALVTAFFTGGDKGPLNGGRQAQEKVTRETATANKLYTTGALTPEGCRLPRIGPGAESMRTFMNVLSDCLDRSWTAQFGKAQMRFAPPKRVFWEQKGSSPCGSYPTEGASAFYCPANNTMYIGLRHIVETSGGESLANFAVFARVIAHEYGHHVQDTSGILLYGQREMEQQASDALARAQTSRRLELQAQCLAGAFLGSERATLPMTRTQYYAMVVDVRGRGDERNPPEHRDHGSGTAYAGWVIKGYKGRELKVCNTWTAAPKQVS